MYPKVPTRSVVT
uniref:Uncharacterized protein n=1 Tax=Arundo donax TaxID=35708 RepID=A0A0A9GPD9_ARUDO